MTYKEQRDKATSIIADMQKRQRDVAELDARYTKELADANATKSQQLRQRVAAETDPIRAAFLLGQISKQVSLAPKPKKAIKPEPEVRGGGADAKQDEFNKLCPGAKIE